MSFSAGHFSKTWQGVPQEHLYLPEAGKVWVDTARTTLASPGDPVGAVEDQSGQHYAEQGTTANKPTLREDANGNRYLEFVSNEDFLEVDVTTTKATKVSSIPGVGAWSGESEPGLKGRSKARIQSTTAAALFAGGSQTGATRSDWARRLDQRGKNVADSVTSLEEYFRDEPLTSYDAHAQDTSSVTDMRSMFQNSSVSDLSSLSNWDTSSVTDMRSMFRLTSVSDLSAMSTWDTSSVTNMSAMFLRANSVSDLSPLQNWDTSSVTDMQAVFKETSVSDPSPISGWDVANVTNFTSFLQNAPLDSAKTGDMLDGWTDGSPNTAADLQSGVTLGIQNADYSAMNASGQDAVEALSTDPRNWTVNVKNPPRLLDIYPGAAAGYSLRKLRAGYSGDCIRVRRSSDNAEQDIGFSGGTLDETALTNFVGNGDGFVTTWYGQSSSGRDATQATEADQPKIVSSGSVITDGGEVAIDFAESDVLIYGGDSVSISALSLFSVTRGRAINKRQAQTVLFAGETSSANGAAYTVGNNDKQTPGLGVWGDTFVLASNSDTTRRIYTAQWEASGGNSNIYLWKDQSQVINNTQPNALSITNLGISIGHNITETFSQGSSIVTSENVLYPSIRADRTDIENAINDYYGEY